MERNKKKTNGIFSVVVDRGVVVVPIWTCARGKHSQKLNKTESQNEKVEAFAQAGFCSGLGHRKGY